METKRIITKLDNETIEVQDTRVMKNKITKAQLLEEKKQIDEMLLKFK